VKISVSLADEDVAFLDEYARRLSAPRSAVVQRAVRLLRAAEIGASYADAWEEWTSGGEAEAWNSVVADGID
jgi:predicted transcriptional regulator